MRITSGGGKIKGIIIAGGVGTRLDPLTKTTNKHLLPVYNKQMIFYPLETLINSGIKDVLIISCRNHVGQFLKLLGSGYDLGLNISYTIQEKPLGIAHAIWVGLREFAKEENVFVILADNIFEDTFKSDIIYFKKGAKIFLVDVDNPKDFGVAETKRNKVISLEEKPKEPKSNFAVTGAYIFDKTTYDKIDKLPLSKRGQVEITDLLNLFLKENNLEFRYLYGNWFDMGTFESLFEASSFVRSRRGIE